MGSNEKQTNKNEMRDGTVPERTKIIKSKGEMEQFLSEQKTTTKQKQTKQKQKSR